MKARGQVAPQAIVDCVEAATTMPFDEGLRFERAHVTIAVCRPCRAVWMTGRYPHNNGARSFEPIDDDDQRQMKLFLRR